MADTVVIAGDGAVGLMCALGLARRDGSGMEIEAG